MQKEIKRYTNEEKEVLVRKYQKDFNMERAEAELRVELFINEYTL